MVSVVKKTERGSRHAASVRQTALITGASAGLGEAFVTDQVDGGMLKMTLKAGSGLCCD